ncbi:inositol monophosphatase [Sulfurifustis variabilis]|uniref:Inositol-1-monophosphatase n=1 Tax=Sulfurifustis variabilis TaxID=1675686 RepID=A0A1B4V3J1_9GAMM|nr:inositol monophosphatase family protein [Sulfurifustis variabilis]BAU48130.1 inositol monophosphatase [Sulfurifustis variabilis]
MALHPMLNTAVKAARRAGSVIMRHLDRPDRLKIEAKGRSDFVSDVDRFAEAEIIDILRHAYPDHAILAEETGRHPGGDYCWIIDPLDGTTNFLHSYPHFAVSIALEHKGRLEQAVVFDPHRNELFTATRGQGAQLNERRIRVSQTHDMRHALLGTGFPFKGQAFLDMWVGIFRDLAPDVSGVRRAGSAALDLAHVACGRFDGFWEFGLHAWDMAAGCLLVEEAGGFIGDPSGGQDHLRTGHVVAGNAKIYPELLKRVRAHLPDDWRALKAV